MTRWYCRCDCGTERAVAAGNLRSGASSSCGCLAREITSRVSTKHGGSRDPLFFVWSAMRQRCHNPNNPDYHHYGGRGISVCERWRESYAAFRDDMGPRPSPKHSVDRIDNDGPYSPDNCRWATQRRQMRHIRGGKNHQSKLTADDVREMRRVYAEGGCSQYELAERFGVTQGNVSMIITRQIWGHI